MKKLLVIQTDGTYFLHETLRMLERSHSSLRDFELTVLVSEEALAPIKAAVTPLVPGITCDKSFVLKQKYDLSANLSMHEDSWDYHAHVQAKHKLGPTRSEGTMAVADLWSTFLLTVKAGAPFLTFHLQDIYKNILGIKRLDKAAGKPSRRIKEVVVGHFHPDFLSQEERQQLITELKQNFPALIFKDLNSVDLISDLGHTLYVGPATFDALRVCEAGARGVFLGRSFGGINLLPYDGDHFYVSSRGSSLKAMTLVPFIESIIRQGKPLVNLGLSVYQLDDENLFGTYLKSLNPSDVYYPYYQVHVVLWNFLLSLFDVNLDVSKCSEEQLELMAQDKEVLTKLLRLLDYAMSSIDTIYHQVKHPQSDGSIIAGHLKNLQEIDEVVSKLAEGRPLIRPFLDFYRLRRGQNDGSNLYEQVQHTYLTYSEEQHALTALDELFSVTLRKNEVSI